MFGEIEMKHRPWIALISASCLISACSASEPKWEVIFDGEDLTGWTPKIVGQDAGSDTAQMFRVEDGAIIVAYDPDVPFDRNFGHLFYDEDLSDYRLRFEYKFFGAQATDGPAWAFMNSGVMVHAQAPDTMQRYQAFPVSIEAQLLGKASDTPPRSTANICTPGTHIVVDGAQATQHCISSATEASLADQWVQFEIEVRGGEVIRLYVEGEEAFVLETPTYDPEDEEAALVGATGPVTHGYFALQAESHPIAFRNIQLMRLEPDA